MSVIRKTGYAALSLMARPWRTWNEGGLRILAYHGIHDPGLFRRHLAHLVAHYAPIGAVPQARTTEKPPVWITFDDGDPSIVDVALPVLGEFGLRATAFVCPGVIDTAEPFWWQVIEKAIAHSVEIAGEPLRPNEVAMLKTVPDRQRRERVDVVRRTMQSRLGGSHRTRQLTTDELRRWMDEGHTLGNHTWDHPILSNCSPDEQKRQILTAHEWLVEKGMATKVFAYPNGDWGRVSEDTLARADYTVGMLFDHDIAELNPSLAMSRIRVNGTDSVGEFVAKVSGIHTAVRQRIRI